MSEELTPLDRELIRILQDNGRAPFTQIAREVGITEKTVRKRVGDLVARGVIHIVAVTDPRLLGYDALALVGVKLDHRRPVGEVAAELAQIGAVDYVVVATGRFDLLVEVLAADMSALATVIQQEVLSVQGIAGSETFPYLSLRYQEPRFQAARVGRPPGGMKEQRVDDVDRRILAELSEDGRAPFQTIARTLGVSEAQVRQRVNRMVDCGTARILAITNPAGLGFTTTAWLAIAAAPGTSLVDLAARVAEVPSITYVAVTAGRFDLFAEAVCVDSDDLLGLFEEQLRPLPGVARIEAWVYLDLFYKQIRPVRTAALDGRSGVFTRYVTPHRVDARDVA